MRRKWREPKDTTYIPFMDSISLSCPLIQELEIIGSGQEEFIRQKELASIAHCVHLKRLTLSNFNMDNGQFFDSVC